MSYYSEARKLHEREQYEEAYKLYEQGANAGDEKCYYGIALFLHNGYYVEEEKDAAAKIFAEHYNGILALAEAGDAEAMFIIASHYSNGVFCQKNLDLGNEWLIKSAEAGYAYAQYCLGWRYSRGFIVKKDLDQALKLFKASADKGNVNGMVELGNMYQFGEGVEKDLAKAVELYRASADQNDSTGQWRLGYMYQFGEGVEKNLNKAFELYKASADRDNSKGKAQLATLYVQGKGVEKDTEKAIALFEEAATHNEHVAINDLGCYYQNEKNDYELARFWYEKGVSVGIPHCMWNLGQLYEKGLGVNISIEKAIKLYHKACESKFYICAEVAYRLGYAYYDGEGVKQNKATALEYFQMAYDNGYPCSYAIDMLNNELNKNRKAADNPMRDYANNIISKNLPIKKMYPLVLKDLRKDFGPAWETLQLNSQKFLSTSMVCYIALYSMGGHIYGNMDFTSCITPMFKALETELGKYLYTGYINYLNENKIPVSAFKSKRSFIVLVGEDGPYSTEFTYRDPDDLEHFTLGSLHLVIGMDRKTQGRKGLIEITDTKTKRRESIMIDEGEYNRSSIDPTMLDYAKSIFDEEAFGNVDIDRAITDYLVDLATEIKTITDSFRNPAAHANVMSYEKAETCANYLIKAKKLICKFVEKIKK